jgi:hypothetical protein
MLDACQARSQSALNMYLRVVGVRRLENVTKKQLRLLRHDCAGKCVALVSAQVVVVSPTTTHKLLEVVAWVKCLVIR